MICLNPPMGDRIIKKRPSTMQICNDPKTEPDDQIEHMFYRTEVEAIREIELLLLQWMNLPN